MEEIDEQDAAFARRVQSDALDEMLMRAGSVLRALRDQLNTACVELQAEPPTPAEREQARGLLECAMKSLVDEPEITAEQAVAVCDANDELANEEFVVDDVRQAYYDELMGFTATR